MDNKTRIEKLSDEFASDKIAEASVKEGYIAGYNKGWNDAIEACIKLFPFEHSVVQHWQVKQKLASIKLIDQPDKNKKL